MIPLFSYFRLRLSLIAGHKNPTKSAMETGHYEVEDFDALIPNWNKRRFKGNSSKLLADLISFDK
jgi:hypothetical protein